MARCRPAGVLLCLLLCNSNAFAFQLLPNLQSPAWKLTQPAGRLPLMRRAHHRCEQSRPLLVSLQMGPLDGWVSAAKYRETCPPQSCIEQLLLDQIRRQEVDPIILHWAHPATMLAFVILPTAYATYLGWRIRSSKALGSSTTSSDTSGGQLAASPAGMTDKERSSAGKTHALLMSVAALFSVFGIQGGLGSMLLAGEPILESTHSASGFLFALLLGLQVRDPLLSRPHRNNVVLTVHRHNVRILLTGRHSFSNGQEQTLPLSPCCTGIFPHLYPCGPCGYCILFSKKTSSCLVRCLVTLRGSFNIFPLKFLSIEKIPYAEDPSTDTRSIRIGSRARIFLHASERVRRG